MGAIRTSVTALLITGATGAVLALGVPGTTAATAAETRQDPSFGFSVTPSTVAPGGRAVLTVTRCPAAHATVSSGIFDTVNIARGQTVQVTVDRDARPGAVYTATFTCNGENGHVDLTIAGSTTTTRPTTSSTRTATPNATVPTSARGVQGGLGGSVAGLDPVQLGAGAGLFLAATAGTAYCLRRSSGRRGH
ncbi:hypothetical protein ACTVZO_33760 [Streptomyces sp. IBSNAI002]|uniref:hypothetical protein n=1 Tax=Streptomyces sp. IBSNAI002 TaxID=3457500 RepID=UPI003FD00B59